MCRNEIEMEISLSLSFFQFVALFFAIVQLIFTFYFSVSQDQKFAFKAKTEGCYFYSLKELCCSSSRA